MTEEAAGPGFATLALHAGAAADPAPGWTPADAPARMYEGLEHTKVLFGLDGFGGDVLHNNYPTNALLEERIAALEGGTAALAVASGRAAQFLVLHMLLQSGDECVVGGWRHGWQMPQTERSYKNFGWQVIFADPRHPDSFEKAISPKTKAILVETFAGDTIVDLTAMAKIAQSARLPFIVDNTRATPYLLRPFEHGADIIIHSATKFLGGHDTLSGGVIVDGGSFTWQGDARFPMIAAPRPDLGGLVFAETFGNFAFTTACRVLGLGELGTALSPFNGFLVLNGLETLALRMQRHSDSALRVAEHLTAHKAIDSVSYPGLAGDPAHALAQTYCPQGAGASLSCRLAGGYHAAVGFLRNLKLFSSLGDLGDTRSRASHPASTTHRLLNDVEKEEAGAGPDVIRLAIGLEDVGDLITDLDQALAGA